MKNLAITLRSIFVIIIFLLTFSPIIMLGQVELDLTQTITTGGGGPLLTLKRTTDASVAEIEITNDINKSFDIGISGSTNNFFNNLPSTPYIYNNTSIPFRFWANNNEQFIFNAQATDILTIGPLGVTINKGKQLDIQSENQSESMSFVTKNTGELRILRNGDISDVAMSIDDGLKRIGVNTVNPDTDFHITQATTPTLNGPNAIVSDRAGLSIENAAGDRAGLFVHTDKDLTLTFNGVYRGFWNDSNGNYSAVSDIKLKKNIQTLDSVLDRVLKLRPTTYYFKNTLQDRKSIGFIAQEVEKIFPSVVHQKDNIKGLSYGDFNVIAIKAIQEQQELIELLTNRIEQLESSQE